MVTTLLEIPEKSWYLTFVLEMPGKSWNFNIFLKISWNVLEFSESIHKKGFSLRMKEQFLD